MKLPEKVDMALEMSRGLYDEDLPELQAMASKLCRRYFGKKSHFIQSPTPLSL